MPKITQTTSSLPKKTGVPNNARGLFVIWMSILAAISGIITGVFELQSREYFMGGLDFSVSLFLLGSGVLSFWVQYFRKIAGSILVISGTLLLLVSFVTGGLDNSATTWLGLVPVVGVFVYGWKKAFWLTVSYILYIVGIFLAFPGLVESGSDYSFRAVRQIILSIITYFVASAYFDWQLERSQQDLKNKNLELSTVNQKLSAEAKAEKKLQIELSQSLEKLSSKNEDEENVRRAMINLLEDIQQEKQKSSELSERFMLATQSAMIGVWEWDVKKNVLIWDRNMYSLYGIDPDKFGGAYDAWQSGLHPEDRARSDEAIQLALKGKKDFDIIFRVVWSSGEIRYIKAKALVKRDPSGEPEVMVGVNWDVTREQEIDKAKSEFVSLASHQLRTPLSTIGWYAEMLLAGDAGKLNPEQGEYVGEIAKGNARMVELVNALLNVARLELGTFVIEPELVNVIELIRDTVKEQMPQLEAKSQKLKEDYGFEKLDMQVDKKLLRMVLQNFLSNAIKYTPEKGSVEIGVKSLDQMPKTFSIFGDAKDVLLYVKDTGLGVPDSQKDKIFHKMFRADNVKVTSTEGTGLGLYIAKTIMEQSGGKIWFDSKENKGSTFYALLPKQGMKAKKGSKSLS